GVGPVRARHVRGCRRVLTSTMEPRVRRDPIVVEEDLDRRGRVASLDFLLLVAEELVRNAVEVEVELDVVVDVYAALLKLRQLEAVLGQSLEDRLVELLEELPPAHAHDPHR